MAKPLAGNAQGAHGAAGHDPGVGGLALAQRPLAQQVPRADPGDDALGAVVIAGHGGLAGHDDVHRARRGRLDEDGADHEVLEGGVGQDGRLIGGGELAQEARVQQPVEALGVEGVQGDHRGPPRGRRQRDRGRRLRPRRHLASL
ncbi:MAG: hypothetical protein R3F43_14310 [bacterium]